MHSPIFLINYKKKDIKWKKKKTFYLPTLFGAKGFIKKVKIKYKDFRIKKEEKGKPFKFSK